LIRQGSLNQNAIDFVGSIQAVDHLEELLGGGFGGKLD